jgi:AraC-like DNA-binding protein
MDFHPYGWVTDPWELIGDPSNSRTLAQLCKVGGASKRTVERLFQEDVGMSFGRWRQQLRLMHALRFLGEGAKVTHAALEAGYSTPSAFISMFRKTLGNTPTLYFGTAAKTVDAPRCTLACILFKI